MYSFLKAFLVLMKLLSLSQFYASMKLLFCWSEITNLFVIGIMITQGTQQKIIM